MWNVLTLKQTGSASLLSRELSKYNVAIAGLCEARWADSGECRVDDHFFLWSGPTDGTGRRGVALALSRTARKSLVSWRPISDRLLTAQLLHRHGKLSITVAYAPTNDASEEEKDNFYLLLHSELQSIPRHNVSVVLTDGNATVSAHSRDMFHPPVSGNSFVDLATNDNGERLLDLCSAVDHCIADTWFPRKRIHHWTWYSNDGVTRRALDHVLICRRWRSAVTNCRVYRGAQLGNTDHRMLVATLRLRLKADPSNKYQPKIEASRLRDDPELALRYNCSIANRFSALAPEDREDWPTFKTGVLHSAVSIVGHRKSSPRKPWISNSTLSIIEARRAARLNRNMEEYRRLNRIRNEAIRADRERYWDEQARQLEDAAKQNDQGQVYRLLREAKAPSSTKSQLVKAEDGSILSVESECRARWAEHFKRLLNRPPPPLNADLDMATINASPPNADCPTDPVSYTEVFLALKKLRNNKAPGVCTICAEFLKHGGESMIHWLTAVINKVWTSEQPPEDWRRGIIVPFWKHKGDRLACENHRGISLLSIPGKVFARVLLTRALAAIRSHRRPQQAGFMPNRSTSDHISAVRLLIEKHREFRKNRHLYMAFIDLKAAFDSVDRQSLWKILKVIGVPDKICRLFKALYDTSESCVRVNNICSEWFPVLTGVRQGCVAAPDLFNCVIDYLMLSVSARVAGVQIGDFRLSDLEYADDTLILGSTIEGIKAALQIYDTEALKLGLQINWTKTKVMHVGEGQHHPPNIEINNQSVQFVSSFVYLGSTVTSTGDIDTEVRRRCGLASGVMRALWKPLWCQRSISRRTKLRIYNAAVLPVLLYGAETWPLSKSLAQRLLGFESKALRQIEGVSWREHITNEDIRLRTSQPPVVRTLAQRRVRWFGHIQRLPDSHPTIRILSFDPIAAGWRRPRGAPRTRWLDLVRKDLQRVDIRWQDVPNLAADRRGWRNIVQRVGSTPSWHET